jgi:hypothetical protein
MLWSVSFAGKTIQLNLSNILFGVTGEYQLLMERSRVCDACNRKFSAFEKETLSSSIFLMERARMGVPNKKGKAAQGTFGGYAIEGNKNLIKNLVTLTGLPAEEISAGLIASIFFIMILIYKLI